MAERINPARLSAEQRAGRPCALCGYQFGKDDEPVTVGVTGRDCTPVRACQGCAPLIERPSGWSEWP